MTLRDVLRRRDAITEASVSNPALAAKLERELHAELILVCAYYYGKPSVLRAMCRAAHSTTVLEFPR